MKRVEGLEEPPWMVPFVEERMDVRRWKCILLTMRAILSEASSPYVVLISCEEH
jgi:hypothetical protein